MRKAFDANVPKFRPRLRHTTLGIGAEEGTRDGQIAVQEEPVALALDAPDAPDATAAEPAAAPPATMTDSGLAPSLAPAVALGRHVQPEDAVDPAASAVPLEAIATEAPDVDRRRERLLEVKRKVAAAARAVPPMPALPESAARAGESALTLVRDMEAQLTRARDLELALRADLDQARTELARGALENRRAAERLATVERQVEEKRAVLQEMLVETEALEQERDGAVARAQALVALDEERQALLDTLSNRVEVAEKARVEAETEVARLGSELDDRASDAARLRAALAQVTRERDDLARDLTEARRERDELAEARKALEQVHEALATARARLG